MAVLLWLHIIAAAIWLGGLVMLAVAVVAALRTLEREQFRAFIRVAARVFAGLALVAWLLLGATGLAMAERRGWSRLLVDKTGLAVLVVVLTVVHTLLGMRTGSRAAVMASRTVAVLIFLATLGIFWMAVNL